MAARKLRIKGSVPGYATITENEANTTSNLKVKIHKTLSFHHTTTST